MNDAVYIFNGKDITMNVCIQIRAVVNILMDKYNISFEEAMMLFYSSDTYDVLRNVENGFWAESAEYIADRFIEEQSKEEYVSERGRRFGGESGSVG